MNYSNLLYEVLDSLEPSFLPDELAYLAATSKVEGPIRDRIAFSLHKRLNGDLLVHREWKGRSNGWTDIAITDCQNVPQ